MGYFAMTFRNALLSRWAYRFNLVLESGESLVGLVVQLVVWTALYSSVQYKAIAGYNISDLLTYTVISRFASIVAGTKFATDIAASIQSGDIVMNFVRPVVPRNIFVIRAISEMCVSLLIIGVPTILIAFFIPGMHPPKSIVNFALFVVSLFSGLLIGICFELLSGVLAFWRLPGDFMEWYFSICFYLLSGATVPLWFFPHWLMVVAKLLPFQAAFFIPVQIYMGQMGISGIVESLLVQFAWIVGLFTLQEVLWRRGTRYLTVLGG